ncbi:MAG: B12-binding domain-containing radical SAM protein [Candidatus Odinarchaeum yellowstonii]|uniref:B12-binding domain-containing radical SAM protein n=1 Tax=Odinarchaeota yellowstonii (strain LCB_4) TaxID=1841599 RepID=A0AAF0D3X1_ODILC|nr:MAG: B12-binding domain-containing radical SAM protein [Candidatus Odinarchaeum yellowstonii]
MLIAPPLNFRRSFKELYEEYTCDGSLPPMGLMYLTAVLRNKGFQVKLFDLTAIPTTPESFRKLVEDYNPDIVGFSIIADAVNTSMILAGVVKKVNPNCLVIGGGISPTFLYHEILSNCPYFDIIVRGEGEYALLEIVELADKNMLWSNINNLKGVAYRANGVVKINEGVNIIKKLDELPIPDRSALTFNYTYQFGQLELSSKKFTTILTSRGCPFQCRFCACSAFTQSTYRARSPEKVLDEFEYIYSEGYRQVLITDDHFFLTPKRTISILKGLRERHIDMDIICESRVDFARSEVLKEAYKSGVKTIFYGMESGSQKILDYYQKKITVSQIYEAVEKTRNAGINMIVGSFMFGAPGETWEDMLLTVKLILSLDLDVPILNIVDVLPGTDLWFEAEKRGILPADAWRKTVNAARIFPETVPVERIKFLIDKTYSLFIKRGHYIGRQLVRTFSDDWRRGLVYRNLRRLGLSRIAKVFKEYTSSRRMYKYQFKNQV